MENIYYLYQVNKGTIKIGNEDALIQYIAGRWQLRPEIWCEVYESGKKYYYNPLISLSYCENQSYQKNGKIYQFFDSKNRIINPINYKEISFLYYKQGKTLYLYNRVYYKYYLKWYTQANNYKFRYDPVPFVHRFHGSYQRMQKTKHIFMAHDDPLYGNKYARGTTRGVPSWWDDKIKKRDIKNWKHQSKCRHQWQRGEKDHWLGQ